MLKKLCQGSDLELYAESGAFWTPLSCPALRSAGHIAGSLMNEYPDELMNELAGNNQSAPALLSFAYLVSDLRHSHLEEVTYWTMCLSRQL